MTGTGIVRRDPAPPEGWWPEDDTCGGCEGALGENRYPCDGCEDLFCEACAPTEAEEDVALCHNCGGGEAWERRMAWAEVSG